jgi:hypothetical protein
LALVLKKSWPSSTPSVVSYWVQVRGKIDVDLVKSSDISKCRNGDDIQQDEEKAVKSWLDWCEKTQKDDEGYYPIPGLEKLNNFSELPCNKTHDKYEYRYNHKHDFWFLTGCKGPFHLVCFMDRSHKISVFKGDYASSLMSDIMHELSQARKAESKEMIEYWKSALDRRVAHPNCKRCHSRELENKYLEIYRAELPKEESTKQSQKIPVCDHLRAICLSLLSRATQRPCCPACLHSTTRRTRSSVPSPAISV